MLEDAATEATRIGRVIRTVFSSDSRRATAFHIHHGQLLTCAHCVAKESGEVASRVEVTRPGGRTYDAAVAYYDRARDLALLSTTESVEAPSRGDGLPALGSPVLFAGVPQGVTELSVFPGTVSATGPSLMPGWTIQLIQIAGMINNGNSGGPLLDSDGRVLGVVTAKYVPLLEEVRKLEQQLQDIPQIPSSVGLGNIDFGKFANLTLRSLWQLSVVLGHVQVGTGWCVPISELNKLEE